MSQKQHKNKKELAAELHLAMSGKKKTINTTLLS